MHFVHGSHGDVQEAVLRAGVCLEVRRGRTQFPVRPLASGRCLIGSGTNCHLQLGGEIPILHSLLVHWEGQWTVEAIAPEPPLLVNGEACRQRRLCVGDRIQIGAFEFTLIQHDGGGRESGHHRPPGTVAAASSIAEEAATLSARNLLARIEEDLGLVETFENRRLLAGKALLKAMQQQRESDHTEEADRELPRAA